jgi:hypothetical protein
MFIMMEKPAAAICGTNANASVNRSVTAGVPGGGGPVATSTSAPVVADDYKVSATSFHVRNT